MKRILIVLLSSWISSATLADLAVEWKSNVGLQYEDNSFLTNGMAQLVWSLEGIPSTVNNNVGGAVDSGQFILNQINTGIAGTWAPTGFFIYDNADVGGQEINSGFFFTRIYEEVNATFGSNYIDVNQVAASNWVFNPLSPLTVYAEEATGFSSGSILKISDAGTTVIPEPSTITLLGFFSGLLYFARRRFRR